MRSIPFCLVAVALALPATLSAAAEDEKTAAICAKAEERYAEMFGHPSSERKASPSWRCINTNSAPPGSRCRGARPYAGSMSTNAPVTGVILKGRRFRNPTGFSRGELRVHFRISRPAGHPVRTPLGNPEDVRHGHRGTLSGFGISEQTGHFPAGTKIGVP